MLKLNLPGLLLVVFVVLKLTGLIAWSWVWVLSPLWIPLLLVLVIFALAGFIAAISGKLNR